MHTISTTILSILLAIPLCAQSDEGKQWAQHVSKTIRREPDAYRPPARG